MRDSQRRNFGLNGSQGRRKVCLAVLLASALAGTARADVSNDINVNNASPSTFNWTTAPWSLGHVPAAGESVEIVNYFTSDTLTHGTTVTYDTSASAALHVFILDGSYGANHIQNTTIFNQPQASFSTTGDEEIGAGEESSADYNQSGGSNTCGVDFFLGGGIFGGTTNSIGTYELSGSATFSSPTMAIGVSGLGTFTQSGGSCTYSNYMYIGGAQASSPIGHGTYTLKGSSSTLSGGALYVGRDGAVGVFSQLDGTNTPTALTVGYGSGTFASSGTYTIGGGTLSPQTTTFFHGLELHESQPINLGANGGSGYFYQSGGTVTTSSVNFGDSTGTGGAVYDLEGGLLATGGLAYTGGFGIYSYAGTLETTATFTTNVPIDFNANADGGPFHSAAFSPDTGTTCTLTGGISGVGSLILSGLGTLAVTNFTNTYLGGTIINAGTLAISDDTNLGATAGGITFGDLVLGNPFIHFVTGTLEVTSGTLSNRTVSLGAFGGTIQTDAETASFAGVISGSGPLTKTGSGTLQLLAGNTFSGGINVTAGTLAIGPTSPGTSGTPFGSGPVTLAGATLQLQGGQTTTPTQQRLAVTGFNQDVVVERGAANARGAVTTAFDNLGTTTSGFAFFESGYAGQTSLNGSTTGLPQNTVFTSATNSAVSFGLQPYNASNVLVVSPNNTGFLTLSDPGRFATISVLAAAANGTAAAQFGLLFSDGSSYVVGEAVPDWFTTTPGALIVNGRIGLSTVGGVFDNVGSQNPRLYEFDITVPAFYASKVLTSVAFVDVSGGTFGVFAVSGNGGLVGGAQIYASTDVNITADSTINITNSPAAVMRNITITGSTLYLTGVAGSSLEGNVNLSGNTTIDTAPGTTLFADALSGGDLTKNNTGTMRLLSNSQVGNVTLNAGKIAMPAQGKFFLGVQTFSMGTSSGQWTGQFDIGHSELLISSGNLANVASQIAQGYNRSGTHWTGNGIITSSGTAITAVGYIDGATYLMMHNAGDFGFGTTISASNVLVKYTYAGDATMDGKISAADYALIDAGFLTGHFDGVSNVARWVNGDFNYDGVVNYQDYALIDAAFMQQSGTLAAGAMIDDHAAVFGAPYIDYLASLGIGSTVPEPGSLALLIWGAGLLLGRTRRGRNAITSRNEMASV